MTRRATTDEPSLFAATAAEPRPTVSTPPAPPPPSKPPAPQMPTPKPRPWTTFPGGAAADGITVRRGRDGWFYVDDHGGRCFRTLTEALAWVDAGRPRP